MKPEYYLDLAGQTAGPFTLDEVAARWRAGTITGQTIYTRMGEPQWYPVSTLVPIFGEALAVAARQSAAPPINEKQIVHRSAWLCQQCGDVGEPRLETKGSFLIEVVLWIFFCVPGLIYSIWRVTTRGKVCRVCASRNIIPATSPQARQVLDPVNWRGKSV